MPPDELPLLLLPPEDELLDEPLDELLLVELLPDELLDDPLDELLEELLEEELLPEELLLLEELLLDEPLPDELLLVELELPDELLPDELLLELATPVVSVAVSLALPPQAESAPRTARASAPDSARPGRRVDVPVGSIGVAATAVLSQCALVWITEFIGRLQEGGGRWVAGDFRVSTLARMRARQGKACGAVYRMPAPRWHIWPGQTARAVSDRRCRIGKSVRAPISAAVAPCHQD